MIYPCGSDTLLVLTSSLRELPQPPFSHQRAYPYRDGAVVMAIINNQGEINRVNKAGFPVQFALFG